MTEPWMIVVATVVGLIILKLVVLAAMTGGDFGCVMLAWRASIAILRDKEMRAKIEPLLAPTEQKEPKLSGEPLRMLVLLQREGRLVDFLLEDIEGATNDQIGAGVREIHRESRHAIKEHLDLEPVMKQQEGESVEVPEGFDPSAIQLTGNVTGEPPFKGVLKHPGWRVTDIKLSKPPADVDDLVLQPAIVDIP